MSKSVKVAGRPQFYAAALLLLDLLICSLFCLVRFGKAGTAGCAYLVLQCIGCSFLYMLPALFFAWLSNFTGRFRIVFEIVALLLAFATTLFLLLDFGIMCRFGYHVNGLVINLLCTKGGFESMGLDFATIAPMALGILLFAVMHVCLWLVCFRTSFCGGVASFVSRPRVVLCALAVYAFSILAALLVCGIGHFYANVDVLSQYDAYPVALKMRMRKFLLKIGLEEPQRDKAYSFAKSSHSQLKYPQNQIIRIAPETKYNIIWLVCESLRYDLLSQEAMPACWKLAEKSWRFDCHYSGGYGTRPGMFSMFYGLYAPNWDAFLMCRRGPLLIDWLQEDEYAILCQTSAKFSYPEFDKTIFASVPTSEIVEIDKKQQPYERDVTMVNNMLLFMEKEGQRPFFMFGFFESTHAPYSFPKEAVVRKDYLENINYTTVSKKDAMLLYNRDVNAAHHIDAQMKRIFDYLEARPDLGAKTIIIVTGDHGEEFFEKGRLGHNSAFVEEQIRTPLVIHVPGQGHNVVSHITSHTDIVATLAPLLGVRNNASDYTVGQNLLSPDYSRDSYVVCGWDKGILMTND
ncbi:MAG: sulfatase-like hydrolase/transferase, partial [Victivallales bacterium]|nr:sulfatase-like hydrolase/transferase [Victivallales bacterium]